jgi:hypothetical protein
MSKMAIKQHPDFLCKWLVSSFVVLEWQRITKFDYLNVVFTFLHDIE